MTTTKQVALLINNTGADIRGLVEDAAWKAAREGTPLPEEIADVFTLTVFEIDGETRARLDFA